MPPAGLQIGSGPCPYLPDRESTLLYLRGRVEPERYRELLDEGFRRCGDSYYRPICQSCNECKILRVPVATFTPSREQRRVRARGENVFTLRPASCGYSHEKAAIYRRYLEYQHEKVEESDQRAYEQFLVATTLGKATFELQLWADQRLAGVGVVDQAGDALSSVYFYFDPEFARFSPGTYSALAEIDYAREQGLQYYYLGYYIAGCASMRYKAKYRPCDIRDIRRLA